MNIQQFKEDMRSGMPIEDVLEKHNVDFSTAWKLMKKSSDPRRKINKKKSRSKKHVSKADRKYINRSGKKYYVRKNLKGKTIVFGSYKTLQDAMKVRDCLVKEGWDKSKLKSIWKKCMVNQEE